MIGGILHSANLLAQADSSLVDINYFEKSNVWLSSKNVAGLNYFKLSKLSTGELYANKGFGDFRNYYQSNNQYSYGLKAKSFHRLNPNIVFKGSVDYQQFSGKNMSGSSFIDPTITPFDILETDISNKGIKELETYKLSGAISARLNSKLTIGGKLDYGVASFAKTKDLRHINKLLDLDIDIGLIYQLSKRLTVGGGYGYGRRIEELNFRIFGNVTSQYNYMVSFGAFYGMEEVFTPSISGGAYAADGTSGSNPLANFSHNASLQLNLALNNNWSLFQDFSYVKQNGYYGNKGTAAKLFTEHNADQVAYKLSIIKEIGRNQHQLSVGGQYQQLINMEHKYIPGTSSGGVSTTIYLGKVEVLDKQQLNVKLDYTFFKEVENHFPKWEFNLAADYFRLQQTASMSPYYRDQTINSYQANINLKRNIFNTNNIYSWFLGLGYGSGSGLAKYDSFYIDPSTTAPPTSMDLYLYQEFEYFTKPRVMADVSLQYTKKMKQNIAPYAKLSYNYTKAFDTQFLGGSFGIIGASVGCNF